MLLHSERTAPTLYGMTLLFANFDCCASVKGVKLDKMHLFAHTHIIWPQSGAKSDFSFSQLPNIASITKKGNRDIGDLDDRNTAA